MANDATKETNTMTTKNTKTTKKTATQVAPAPKASKKAPKTAQPAHITAFAQPHIGDKPEPELGNAKGITLVSGTTETPVVEAPKAPKGKKAAKQAKAPKAPKAEKAPKELKLRLYAKGEFFFPKLAAEKLNGAPYVKFEAKGKTVTLTPTKSAKDSTQVMFCHAAPVLRVAKLLAETGWSKATQDLAVKMVGDAFQVHIS